jgi:serine/threonine protein kinase
MAASVIDGRYVIRGVLSPMGGGGQVFEVEDIHEHDIVVLKVLSSVPTGNPWQEAQILRHLSDPHILPIRNAAVASGVPYIVTEWATHGTLQTRLGTGGGLGCGVDEVVRWMSQAALGIARAHDRRLLHNDIKPANLFLNAEGEVLVGDFGGASWIPPGATHTAPLQATAETVAPEIAAGWPAPATASFVSDVYSLGATAFWMLSGTTPHDFTKVATFASNFDLVARTPARSLRHVAPHVPRSVATVVEQAIHVDPTKRIQTVLEFSSALSSRNLPDRRWMRTNTHATHIGCWEGTSNRTGGIYSLCVTDGPRASQCEIRTVHAASGRRVTVGCTTKPMRSWPQAVRSVIQALG